MSNADTRNAFEALKEKIPADLVPGYSVYTPPALQPDSPWLARMRRFSKDLNVNAYAYFNFIARRNGPLRKTRRTPKRIISPEGFPPWVNVSYAYPPPQAFYSVANTRAVRHFVFHSFGHAWHATTRDKTPAGWMNSSRNNRGVQAYEHEGKTVFVPKGSDPETLEHFTRFSAGLRACLNSAARATAHFFIDRGGNLVVVGDCNDVMFTSNGLNKTSCGVELEEAFYVLENPKKGRGHRALWKPGGRPPGTAGNVEYFLYSAQQLYTLSVLVKKLETAYPVLKERNVSFERRAFTRNDPPGYTMHDFIKGSSHLDISPQFLTQDLWDAFFDLVDTHTHITPANVFKPKQAYGDDEESLQVLPLSDQQLEAATEQLFETAQVQGVGYNRSTSLAKKTRKETNQAVGKIAVRRARKASQQVSDLQQVSQKTQDPLVDSPSRSIPLDSKGRQVGSDDMW